MKSRETARVDWPTGEVWEGGQERRPQKGPRRDPERTQKGTQKEARKRTRGAELVKKETLGGGQATGGNGAGQARERSAETGEATRTGRNQAISRSLGKAKEEKGASKTMRGSGRAKRTQRRKPTSGSQEAETEGRRGRDTPNGCRKSQLKPRGGKLADSE